MEQNRLGFVALALLASISVCDAYGIESTAGRRLLQRPECSPGQYFKTLTRECINCDPNCRPNACRDSLGCRVCKSGFFTSREDEEWPFDCLPCTIRGCVRCVDGGVKRQSPRCAECSRGFERINNGERCQDPNAAIDDSLIVSQSQNSCQKGEILRQIDMKCVECDARCLPDECSDFVGCRACPEQYFTSRRDPRFPFKCRLCDVPNCAECQDGIIDGLPPRCIACRPGHNSIDGGLQCVPFSVDASAAGRNVDQITNAVASAEIDSRKPICSENEFLSSRGICLNCDSNCDAGECVDSEGCTKCLPNFVTVESTATESLKCRECDIPDCVRCAEGLPETNLAECAECSAGFNIGPRRLSCIKPIISSATPESGSDDEAETQQPESSTGADTISGTNESTVPEPEEGSDVTKRGSSDEDGSCPDGEFASGCGEVSGCQVCDAFCRPGSCLDVVGCVECQNGFVLARTTGLVSLHCAICSIENCRKCVNGKFEFETLTCEECADGYYLDIDGKACKPESERIALKTDNRSLAPAPAPENADDVDEEKGTLQVLDRLPKITSSPTSEETFGSGASPGAKVPLTADSPSEQQEDTGVSKETSIPEPIVDSVVDKNAPSPQPGSLPDAEFSDAAGNQNANDNDSDYDFAPLPSPQPEKQPGEGTSIPSVAISPGVAFGASDVGLEDGGRNFAPLDELQPSQDAGVGPASSPSSRPRYTIRVSQGACDDGYFQTRDLVCAKCDDNCTTGGCIDLIGCIECKEGVLGSKAVEGAPQMCRACDIPNCRRCVEGILDSASIQCEECDAGFEGQECQPSPRSQALLSSLGLN